MAIAMVKRTSCRRNTPAETTNSLNGNGGGKTEATSTDSTSYRSSKSLNRFCFDSEKRFNARWPARFEIRYKPTQPAVDPNVAEATYINIHEGRAAASSINIA